MKHKQNAFVALSTLFCAAQLWAAPPVAPLPTFNPAQLEAKTAPANAIWLESLELQNVLQSSREPEAGQSVDDRPLSLEGKVYPHGVGTLARAIIRLDLKGSATRFVSRFGLNDRVRPKGSIALRATVDGVLKYESEVIRGTDASQLVNLDLRGAQSLVLEVLEIENSENDHADFAGAMLFLTPEAVKEGQGARPFILPPPPKSTIQLPVVLSTPNEPRINGARVVGVSPGKPFLHLIPATGKGTLTFSAQNLPAGLQLDAKTGIITGKVATAGTYNVTLSAKNGFGNTKAPLRIECAPGKMMLTPLLGWNCWSVFGETVTAKGVAEQADWMVESGLAARGWNTIIVDDTWQSRRDADGTIGSNKRFGSMKSLIEYVHSKGLKFGLLSAATPNTCSGYAGSAGWEEQDAALYARWGVDLVKYDWCPESGRKSGTKPEDVVTAYKKMRAALDKTDRDIALSMVTYGFGGNATDIGKAVGAQTWRTISVLNEAWDSVKNAAFSQRWNAGFASPGHWNDWGTLYVGRYTPRNPHFTTLTPDEQKFQITAWAMGASAMVLSCDMSQLDPNLFYRVATPLLTNPGLIAIQQDELGKAATVLREGDVQLWSRPLADGTLAVAVLNASGSTQRVPLSATDLKLSEAGFKGPQPVRDVWAGQQVTTLADAPYETVMPRHSAALFIVGTPSTTG